MTKNDVWKTLGCTAGVVLLIGIFGAGYFCGYYDAFEESRVRTGEISDPHYILPRIGW